MSEAPPISYRIGQELRKLPSANRKPFLMLLAAMREETNDIEKAITAARSALEQATPEELDTLRA